MVVMLWCIWDEILAIFRNSPIWIMLGTQDIKLKYRRSSIGPFWITISMAVTVYSMGYLYGHLFKAQLNHYFPFLASGIISWSFISLLITESSASFINSENYIKNQETFLSLFVMRVLLRNFIIFLHNLLVYIPIIFIFHVGLSLKTLLLIPGLFIISVNVLTWGNVLAIVGTRYRDFEQIINSLVQVIFFLTPIMWMPTLLPEDIRWAVNYNPFYQFINLIRMPLLSQVITMRGLLLVVLITVIGFGLYSVLLNKYKQRIVFWL